MNVAFRLPPGTSGGAVYVALVGEEDVQAIPVPSDELDAVAQVGLGHCSAFFQDEAGMPGPCTSFEVSEEGQVVDLAAPSSFDIGLEAVDYRAGEKMPGLELQLLRTDLSPALQLAAKVDLDPIVATSDAAGRLEFSGLLSGTYNFKAEHPGFEAKAFSLDLPGQFLQQVQQTGKADLGELRMVSLQDFAVQLVGFQDWGGAEGFSIAHTHQGERVTFDPTGRAKLSLGWYSTPLYLKWWYPSDGQEAVAYLDGGLPAEKEPWLIDVGKGTDLEIDLRVSESLLDAVNTSDATLRVTTVSSRGDSLTQGVGAQEPGVFTIRGIVGQSAMVEYIAHLDGKEVSLGVEKVPLKDGRRSSCILNIDSLPTVLTFVDASGAPLPGAYLELRERGSATGWTFGAEADASGQLRVTIPARLDLSMRAATPGDSLVAVDCPVAWEAGLGDLSVALASSGPLRLRATMGGLPAPGVQFSLFGAHSSNSFLTLTTGETGEAKPLNLVEGSTARLRLASNEYWMSKSFLTASAGDLAVEVYGIGELSLAPGVDPGDVIHTQEGRTVGSWIQDGLATASPGAPRTLKVPSGQYRLVQDGETVWDGLLPTKGALLVAPSAR